MIWANEPHSYSFVPARGPVRALFPAEPCSTECVSGSGENEGVEVITVGAWHTERVPNAGGDFLIWQCLLCASGEKTRTL